jgi:opacity protein-like surface antigen
MKKLACLLGLLLVVGFSASAQDSSKVDIFGGYTYLRYSPGGSAPSVNFNGGTGSLAYNLTDHIAGVGEFSFDHAGSIPRAPGVTVNTVSYLFGPKVYATSGKIAPFGQVLFGGVHASCSSCGGNPSANAFGMALGGGLDWGVSPHLAVRLGQLDYVMTRFSTASGYGGASNQNSFRYSVGVVFKF